MLPLRKIIEYELMSSWWLRFVPARWEWLIELVIKYYAWKAIRKHNRYFENTKGGSDV